MKPTLAVLLGLTWLAAPVFANDAVITPAMQPVLAALLPEDDTRVFGDGSVIAGVSVRGAKVGVAVKLPSGEARTFVLEQARGATEPGRSQRFVVHGPPGDETQAAKLSAWLLAHEAGFQWADLPQGPSLTAAELETQAAARWRAGDAAGAEGILQTCGVRFGACSRRKMARAAEEKGDVVLAAQWLDAELGDGSRAERGLLEQRVTLAMRAGDCTAELLWSKRAAERFPDDPALLELRASSLYRAEQYEAAIAGFERVHRLDPQRRGQLAHLAGALHRLCTPETPAPQLAACARVRAAFAARARNADDTLARFVHGVAIFYDGRFDETLAALGPLEARLPHEPRVLLYQAMAHHWLGRAEEARALAARAVQAGPEDPDVYYCRSKVNQARDPLAAAADLQHYIALAEAPGAIAFADKTARVRRELACLQRGEVPPDWDRPGGPRSVAPWWAAAGALVAGLGGLVVWRRRRSGRAA
jgi:LPXTG-motif cell wall-anchored protein